MMNDITELNIMLLISLELPVEINNGEQVPVAAQSKARTVFNRSGHCDCRFESCSRHGCVYTIFCVVLSCVGRGLVSD
jgi:hypothetical protein